MKLKYLHEFENTLTTQIFTEKNYKIALYLLKSKKLLHSACPNETANYIVMFW